MTSRITPAEALMMPSAKRNAQADGISAIISEARYARDAAIAARFRGFFRGIRTALTSLRTRRETIEQLRSLTDRELADIGLSRSGITAAVSAAAPSAANDYAETRRAA